MSKRGEVPSFRASLEKKLTQKKRNPLNRALKIQVEFKILHESVGGKLQLEEETASASKKGDQ